VIVRASHLAQSVVRACHGRRRLTAHRGVDRAEVEHRGEDAVEARDLVGPRHEADPRQPVQVAAIDRADRVQARSEPLGRGERRCDARAPQPIRERRREHRAVDRREQ